MLIDMGFSHRKIMIEIREHLKMLGTSYNKGKFFKFTYGEQIIISMAVFLFQLKFFKYVETVYLTRFIL